MRASSWEVLSLFYLLGNSGEARGHATQRVLTLSNQNDRELCLQSKVLNDRDGSFRKEEECKRKKKGGKRNGE
jgi:hypothetical protein